MSKSNKSSQSNSLLQKPVMRGDFDGFPTHGNLHESFGLESGTAQRYRYFAQLARIEGHLDVAELFDELAQGGLQSAHGSLDYLAQVADPKTGLKFGETPSNLALAIAAETYEGDELYPAMSRKAREDGFPDIASWFDTLGKLKRSHVSRLHRAADNLAEFSEGPVSS